MNKRTQSVAAHPRTIDPTTLNDTPHTRLAELRQETPLVQLGPNQYLVLRAEHVVPLFIDPRTRQIEGPEFVALHQIPDGTLAQFLSDLFLFSNGTAHRAKRSLFARSFAHRVMRDARGQIRTVADEIVASLPRGKSFDFVEGMAARVPADMIAAILGLPRCDSRYFAALVYSVARAFSPIYPHEHHQEIENAAGELYDYVEQQLSLRMTAPEDDLLTALVTDWQAERGIRFESLVFQVVGLIIGGSDTTRASFAMLVALLLQRPGDWAALRSDPTLIAGAVNEGMRYDPSVGSVPRVTKAPIKFDGIDLPPGTVLRLSTMSAMRDPALYLDPDHFNIRRTDHPRLHMVFGLGPHRCIGDMLARIEMEESLSAVLDAAPGIELETLPRMLGFGGLRQITPMHVRIP